MRGGFTHVGEREASVIDYVAVNTTALIKIKYSKVEERTESDHLPLRIEMEGGLKKGEKEIKKKDSKMENI